MFSFRELGTVEASHRVGLPKRTPGGGGGGERPRHSRTAEEAQEEAAVLFHSKEEHFPKFRGRALTDTAYRYSRACSNNIAR